MQSPNLAPRTRRIIGGVTVLGVAGSLALAGCSQDQAAEGGDKLVIQVQSVQQPAFEFAAEILKETHPDVEVEFQIVTEEQKVTTNSQIMASSSAPDIGLVPANSQPYFDLVKADKLVAVDDVWENADLEARYGEDVANALKWDGTPYLTLFDSVIYNVVYYNEAAFEAAGITAPENHQITSDEELYSIVDKLNDAGYDGLAAGGGSAFQLGWLMDAQLQANASESGFQDFLTSWRTGEIDSTPYTSPEFVDSVAHIQEWSENGVFPTGFIAQQLDQAQAMFTAGEAGMFLGGSWMPSILEVDFDFDWLLLPGIEEGSSTLPTLFTGDTLAIPTSSKNIDLAKEFLEIYSSDEVQTFAAANVGSLPAVNTVDAASIPELGEVVQSIVEFGAADGTGIGWTATLPSSIGETFIVQQLQQLISGQLTPDQVGEGEQQRVEDYVAQNG